MNKINFVNDNEPDISAENLNQMQENIRIAIEALYPIGSVYMNLTNETNPAELFGFGTWERVKDTFIYALGDEGEVGDTGGSATHSHTQASKTGSTTLTAAQSGLPAHSHSFSTGGYSINIQTDTAHSGLPLDSGFASGTNAWFSGNNKNIATIANNTAKAATSGHTHTLGSTNSSSSLPPYTKAYMWKRTT